MPETPAIDWSQVESRQRHRFRRDLKRAKQAADRDRLIARIQASAQRVAARRSAQPVVQLAPDLPVTQRADDIRAAIRDHQVIVVTGDTGSGKTTQLPKILLDMGYGAAGLIGHTQPRRLAARSVAQRIAEELGQTPGGLVGFQTRFDDAISDDSQIKLMTDGILLAETRRDRFLNRYEALIVDEAHERSLNIDFLLGYLKRILPKRPDLKLVITSATIDPERLSAFFDDAPIVAVEGRTYPVELRYAPPEDSDDLPEAIWRSVQTLWREAAGDVLVFLPGERDIRDTDQHLSRALAYSRFSGAEVLPLYSRLTRSAQDAIFKPSRGRRIVLATNVAETSLTVPGIRYVIDSGLARISRYSTAARVQRLPIEPVSQASCKQRMGRCGRVSEGICVRLFDEDDFNNRPAFTDPEIRRTNLASVLLTMADLQLGDIEAFPFIDPPEGRYIRDGMRLLQMLEAMDERGQITALGRQLARLPLDPRIARALIAGQAAAIGPAVRVLCAGLTIQDPRERPADKRQAADEAQREFLDKQSDFVSLLKLWDAFQLAKRDESGNGLRRWCHRHFIHFMRMREWEDLVRQLRQIERDLNWPAAPAKGTLAETDVRALHQVVLSGFIDQIGVHDERGEYIGARNRKFRIFPGSGVAKASPRWIVAGEILETSRLYAHQVGKVEPEWIEAAGAHLLTREQYDPRWSVKSGRVEATERVRLFGLPLADGRKVDFGRIDAETARELFIREALIPHRLSRDTRRDPMFLAHNRELVESIAEQEARFRRRDLLVDEVTQFAFYDERLPVDVHDRAGLLRWLKTNNDSALRFDEATLLRHAGLSLPEKDYPETLAVGSTRVALRYHFEPGHPEDGITAVVPLPLLNQIHPAQADWLVPGMLEDAITERLKALPKSIRRKIVPVPDTARRLRETLDFGEGELPTVLREALHRMTGAPLPADVWQDYEPTPHLRMRFEVIGDDGAVLAAGRDLDALRDQLGAQAREAVQTVPDDGFARSGLTTWDVGDLPDTVRLDHGGVTFNAIPTLVDRGQSVDLELVDDADKAARWHRQGVIRLLRLALSQQARFLKRELDDLKLLAAAKLPEPPPAALAPPGLHERLQRDPEPVLFADLLETVIHQRMETTPRTQADFEALVETVRAHAVADGLAIWTRVAPALRRWLDVQKRLGRNIPLPWMPAVGDIRDQLDHLVFGGCLRCLPDPRHLDRYLKAVEMRLDKLAQEDIARDKERARPVQRYWNRYKDLAARAARRGEPPEALINLRWMIEEFRVQIFAQPLGTSMKVSEKRLDAAIAAL
mgnify:FL=1